MHTRVLGETLSGKGVGKLWTGLRLTLTRLTLSGVH